MNDRVACLLSHLGVPRRDEVAAIEQLDAILDDQYRDGATTWPTVTLTTERYLEHLGRRVRDRASEPAERIIRTMPAADLYLAAACADGDEAAIVAFRQAIAADAFARAAARQQTSTPSADSGGNSARLFP